MITNRCLRGFTTIIQPISQLSDVMSIPYQAGLRSIKIMHNAHILQQEISHTQSTHKLTYYVQQNLCIYITCIRNGKLGHH